MERFCLYHAPKDTLVESYNTLSEPAVDPRDFALPSWEEHQNHRALGSPRLAKFRPDVPFGWVKSKELLTGESYLVPSCFVYVGYRFNSSQERICFPDSTGAACARSHTNAVLKGVLEVIERDSFMICWLNRLEPQRIIDLEATTDKTLRDVIRRLSGYQGVLRVFLLPTDFHAYVVLATIVHESPHRHTLCSGLSASLDAPTAVTKAVEEAVMVANRVGLLSLNLPRSEIRQLSGCYYNTLESLGSASFILNTKRTVRLNTLNAFVNSQHQDNSLAFLAHQMKEKGLRIFVVNIGFEPLEDMGLSVTKAIIPGMQPLARGDISNFYWFMGGIRLTDVPRRLGYEVPNNLNFSPHLWA